jgi:hypothetical protein
MDAAVIHQENESKINKEEARYLYGDAIVCIAPRYACRTDSSRACMGIAGFVPSACADNAHIVLEPSNLSYIPRILLFRSSEFAAAKSTAGPSSG